MKIDKGIPIPQKTTRFPFKEMEVGDSFQIEKKDLNNARVSAGVFAKKTGTKFYIGKIVYPSSVGSMVEYRCWRTR